MNASLSRLFRKYHRGLAIVFALPLFTTILTGILFPIARSMHQRSLAGLLMHIHTLEIFGLETLFPIVNGIGLLGLLFTGLYMTSLIRTRRLLPPES